MLYTLFVILVGVHIGQDYDVPNVKNIGLKFISFLRRYDPPETKKKKYFDFLE